METSNSPQPTTIKSSLESLDSLVGSPNNFSSPSSPFPFLTITTTSDIALTGKYPNTLLSNDNLAPTLTYQEENSSAPAPAVTTVAPLTPPTTITTPSKITMSTPYNSSMDHPHPSAIYTPEPSLPPTSPQYQPSPTPHCQSPLPMSEKSSSPEVISHQKDQETQTYLKYTPPPYPHPITITTHVKEHYLNPEQFLKVFHNALDSLYTNPPHCPSQPTPDVFREKSPIPSAPTIPRPKTTFTKGTNPSLEDTLLRQLLNNKELEIPTVNPAAPF